MHSGLLPLCLRDCESLTDIDGSGMVREAHDDELAKGVSVVLFAFLVFV